MSDYLSLEEAAKKLGIPTDRLVELRSQGQVRGFRDGSSWKFPENEIERLKDDLGDSLAGGSGILVEESDLDLTTASSMMLGSNIIGGDEKQSVDDAGSGSDLNIGEELLSTGSAGSDVNLVASESEGSDVVIVASDADLLKESSGIDLLELDSADLTLNDPAIMHDSAQLDLAIEPNAGSTGPVTDEQLKEIADSYPDVLSPEPSAKSGGSSASSMSDVDLSVLDSNASGISLGSDVLGSGIEGSGIEGSGRDGSGSLIDIGDEELKLNTESDLSFASGAPDDDSGDELIGADEDSEVDAIGSEIAIKSAGASSLELLDELGMDEGSDSESLMGASHGNDVLSELDLLSAEQQGSGLISGDSQDLLTSSAGGSGLGTSIGADALLGSELDGVDDALAEDDDLVIADDDDDLIISSAGSDISVAGDSGINLMSPSDSGLSLESEPLDLAGSSISALDLGAELSEGGSSGSGGGASGSGSLVDFQADEEFQLSPSGVGLDADIDSGSQVIEVEDSEAIAEAVEFGEVEVMDAGVAADPMGADVFGQEAGLIDDAGLGQAEEVVTFEDEEAEAIAIDPQATISAASTTMGAAYEVPFSLFQCFSLMLVICVLSVGGMLMTDLVRNMWTYSELSAPVSGLTDMLIGLIE